MKDPASGPVTSSEPRKAAAIVPFNIRPGDLPMTHHFSTHPASCRPAFRHLPCVTGLLALMCLVSSAVAEPNQADRFIDQGDQWMEKGELDKASTTIRRLYA